MIWLCRATANTNQVFDEMPVLKLRGAAKPTALNRCRSLMGTHKPNVEVLLEAHVGEAKVNQVHCKLGLKGALVGLCFSRSKIMAQLILLW